MYALQEVRSYVNSGSCYAENVFDIVVLLLTKLSFIDKMVRIVLNGLPCLLGLTISLASSLRIAQNKLV